ncbi:MAG: diaminopimelate epimerase [Planctomycetes bacterium]|nr:diaminopimelate epimerase [Planctomycetota bacterium]
MRFTKMHGLGNDYIYVNCFEEKVEDPVELARIVSNRHKGIGADGLVLISPSQTADVQMRIFNIDGSEAEMCGNGIRCVAKYVYEHKLAAGGEAFSVPGQGPCPTSLNIETCNGILTVGLITDSDNKVEQVCVNMGQPILNPTDIPVDLPGEKIVEEAIEIFGEDLLMTCVSMGNPHAIFFCDDVNAIELKKIGPAIENYHLFPNRTNVHFVQVDTPTEFTMRTWERGSGITLACGTGACACAVATVLTGRGERVCTAHLPGGDLYLNWSEEDNCVYMTGPAVEVFEGDWPAK